MFLYCAIVILAALVLGGGTEQGLWTDHVLEIMMIPALFLGLGRLQETRLGGASKLLVMAVLILLAVQFLPVVRHIELGGVTNTDFVLGLLSQAPQKSLESALFTLSVIGFGCLIARMSDLDQERLLRVFIIGFMINVVAAIVQLSFDTQRSVAHLLPYEITAGLFANKNHLSSLIYCMIPVFAYRLLASKKAVFAYLAFTLLLVLFLIAVNSRAGLAIAGLIALLCFIWFVPYRISAGARLAATACLTVLVLLAGWVLDFDSTLKADLRSTIYANTLQAIGDHWLTGAGLGSFLYIYPPYEKLDQVLPVYINHAHNDYMELLLETGVAGLILVAAFYLIILRNFYRSRLTQAAFISIAALSFHSMVDYPLRTMAIAVTFAYFAAVIMSVKPFGHLSDDDTERHEADIFSVKRRSDVSRHGRADVLPGPGNLVR